MSVMNMTNPIRKYYVVPIVIAIISISVLIGFT